MIQRIRDCMQIISVAELEAAVGSTRERMLRCIENDGRQFEHLGRH